MKPSGNKKIERLFALILTQHRRWGQVLMPYILEKLPGREYYSMAEALSPFPDTQTLSGLDNEEREAVRLVNEYSDRNLNKLFSKHHSVREFIENVTDREFEKLIKPYIEQRIHQCLHVALNEDIPLFLQMTKISTLHPEDRLVISPVTGTPVFRFDRDTNGSSYSLIIESEGKQLELRNSPIEILSNKPCVIRADHSLHFISDIDGTKLKPFLSRDKISIQKATEEKYFGTFVLNVINTHKVTGNAFTIEVSEPLKRASITVETPVSGLPAAILMFRYDDTDVYFDDDREYFTTFSNDHGNFTFRKKKRDRDWEKRCMTALEEAGLFTEDEIRFMTPGDQGNNDNALYDLIETIAGSRKKLEDTGITIRTGSLDRQYCLEPVEIRLSHEIINDWFDLKAIVTIGSFSIPFTRLKLNILEGIREYTLPDGTVAILPEEWFTRYRGLFEMGRERDENLMLHKQHFALVSDIISGDDCDICQKLGKLSVPEQLPLLQIPDGVNADLRPYQLEGVSWLHYLQTNNLGGCLADDMGLGKTLQALTLLMWNKANSQRTSAEVKPDQMTLFDGDASNITSLIIVPASLCHNWYNEIRRFCPSLKTIIHHGTQRYRSASGFSGFDVIISSYHTVRHDIDMLEAIDFFYIILDESQHVKNPLSNIYRAVMRLKSEHRMVLTGTPVENSLTDLWTQLSFVNPGLLGSLNFFRREFARPIERNNEAEKETRLRKIIHPFIMRRTKEMVITELPPVTEQVIHCDMSEEQAAIYERDKSAVRNSILENIESMGIEKSAIIILQGLMRLRQIANHPLLTDETYTGSSGKFETVTQNIESVISEGHKILIFSSFVKHLELFPSWLTKNGIGYVMLTGSTRDRENVIKRFRTDINTSVFLMSLKAGGVGLNLTEADYVFILDPWWNPASELQAYSRAHRIGQEKRVFVSRYISGNTIEEKIQQLQEKKSRLAGTFIDSNNPYSDLDMKAMLEILT